MISFLHIKELSSCIQPFFISIIKKKTNTIGWKTALVINYLVVLLVRLTIFLIRTSTFYIYHI